MSIEADFRAVLASHSPLASLVGQRIALNAVPDGSGTPVVVYGVAHNRTLGLDGSLLADQANIVVQCWGKTPGEAEAVADAVVAAVGTAPIDVGAVVTARAGTYDDELGLDGVEMAVEWWA
jgi:hypothetical protein